jgi:3-oxoacyl-[acyl-carrier protein] reductase
MIQIDLAGKHAMVTGSEGGLGQVMVETLLKAGANVISQDIIEPSTCIRLTEKAGKDPIWYKCDITDPESVDSMFRNLRGKIEALDILVNNAGIRRDALLVRMSENQWDAVIDVNLKGVFLCTQAAVKGMLKAKQGKVITVSSIAGIMGNAGQTNYAATKGGVISMTKSWAREYGKRGIIFNAIAPGLIESPMTIDLPEREKTELLSGVPLGYLGKPQDVANVVLFLSSPLSEYINGEVIRVDGGLAM